jgi:hypothetical protein
MPTFPAGQSTTATAHLRFEDVTQDGRMLPTSIPSSLAYLWRDVLVPHRGSRNALAQGIFPILTRLTITSHEQPIRVDRPIDIRAGFELARDPATERIFMNIWTELRGAAGKMSRSAAAGELALAGSLFAEHTFTRPLAPPDQRRVTRLGVDGYPDVPDTRYDAPSATTAQDLPAGASGSTSSPPIPSSTRSRSTRPTPTSTSTRSCTSACSSRPRIAGSPRPGERCVCARARWISRIASPASPAIASAYSSGCSTTARRDLSSEKTPNRGVTSALSSAVSHRLPARQGGCIGRDRGY